MPTAFTHLHTHSEFSLLDGAARLENLVKRAAKLDMGSLALTDHGVMFGTLDFYQHCKKHNVKPILGVEAYVAPGDHKDKTPNSEKNSYHLLLLAENNKGYQNLLKLTTFAAIDGFYYKPRIDHGLLERFHEGIIATSACLGGEVCAALMKGNYAKARDTAGWYRDLLGRDNYYIEIQDHTMPEQRACNEQLFKIAGELGLQVICSNDVHYLGQDDAYAHDVLLCIGTGSTVADTNRLKYASDQFYMKSGDQMAEIFRDFPETLAQTTEIADRCRVDLEFGRAPLPAPGIPEGHNAISYLRELAEKGLERRIGSISDSYRKRLEYELGVVEKTDFAQYFLIVRDFAKFARDKGIYFGVRGSAAGSLTSYCVDITDIDPIDYDITFERFLNPERVQMPDIDMDFEDARRSEVIEYVTEKYGKDHVAQIVTFGTLAARAALKDAGRALGMPIPDVARVVGMIPTLPLHTSIGDALKENSEFKTMYRDSETVRHLVDTAQRLEGLSRHSSVHAAGVVISHEPLTDYTPLQKSQDGGYVTQYPAAALEKLGLLKMDFLGLINLTILGRAVRYIREARGIDIDVQKIPLDDSKAFDMLGRGDTTGVFQLESSGMRRYVKELQPSSVRELAAMVALFRPGPMDHIPTYIRQKRSTEKIKYPHPLLEEVLAETYGVIVYQDQVMRIAQVMSGFTLGQADILRKAMGKKDEKVLVGQQQAFIDGAINNNIDEADARAIFELIRPFAGYAFNKAHAICYAMLAYQTAYLKANYSVEYMAALLASYLDKPEKMALCLEECVRMSIPVLAPDVNRSGVEFSPEGPAVRFGLAGIKNVGKAAVEVIQSARKSGEAFRSLEDFCVRTQDQGGLTKATIEALIMSGALDLLPGNRRTKMEGLERCLSHAAKLKRDRESGQIDLFGMDEVHESASDETIKLQNLPDYPVEERLKVERELLGVYLSDHPLSKFREEISKKSNCTIDELADRSGKDEVIIGGMITSVKPWKSREKQESMAFLTVEDLAGSSVAVNVFPKVFRDFGSYAVKDAVVLIRGKISVREDVMSKEENKRNVELSAEEITPLRVAASPEKAFADSLHMMLDPGRPELLPLLKAALECHVGDRDVVVVIRGQGKERRARSGYRVDASVGLIGELERLLGRGCVWVT